MKQTAKKNTGITTTHPRTGTQKNIDAGIYDAFRSAILQSLKGSKGKTFTEISRDAETIIRQALPGFNGSVSWYTISVRLDLEARGVVETFTEKGKKYSRLAK